MFSAPLAAMEAPITAPTIEWVVETGIPMEVAIVNQVDEPIKAVVIVNINTAGSFLNTAISTILFLIVSDTREPTNTAPKNSMIAAKIIACQYFKDLDETDEEKEFATSLAPMFQASKNAKIMAIANK